MNFGKETLDGGERSWSSRFGRPIIASGPDGFLNAGAGPFAAAIGATRMPIVITNPRLPDNPIVFVNDAFCNLTGYSRAETLGRNPRFLQGPQSDPATTARIRAAVAAAREIEIEVCNHRKDGQPFWNRLLITPVFGDDGTLEYFFGNQVDMNNERIRLAELRRHAAEMAEYGARLAAKTEELVAANERLRDEAEQRLLIEASLRQAQKMEAVGRLAGGIAHDFNNLLMVILGALELIERRVASGRLDNLAHYTSAAIASAQRGANLTRRLLDFARRRSAVLEAVDVNVVLHGMTELMRRSVGPMIELEVFASNVPCRTVCDPGELENAVLNLAINARDAMPEGGQLRIETSLVRMEDGGDEVKPGAYAAILVTDSGSGMSPEVIAHAAEPFFTTKPVGAGTGLGLSMVYGFVRRSGGGLRIDSEPGRGATLAMYLPHCRDDDAASAG
jgi:PAS domain S-box-containing protein